MHMHMIHHSHSRYMEPDLILQSRVFLIQKLCGFGFHMLYQSQIRFSEVVRVFDVVLRDHQVMELGFRADIREDVDLVSLDTDIRLNGLTSKRRFSLVETKRQKMQLGWVV